MFIIGIDPHKGSHTASAGDRDEMVIETIRVDADHPSTSSSARVGDTVRAAPVGHHATHHPR
jgi:hypothetical protein